MRIRRRNHARRRAARRLWGRALDPVALLPYLLADLAARLLSRRARESLARAMARAAFALRVPARRRLEHNLARLMAADGQRSSGGSSPGGARDAAVREVACEAFQRFALAFVDFLELPRLPPPELLRAILTSGEQHFRAARATGRGVIVLSVHAGNWEWGAAYLAARGLPVHVLASPHRSRGVEGFFARRRAAWGVSRLRGRPLWLAAAAALRRREWIAMMGDRPAPGARGSLCAWAAALARRTGAVVLPAAMMRLPDGRYLASFEPPLDARGCAEGRYRAAMLRHVRRAPGQWFGFEPLPEALLELA